MPFTGLADHVFGVTGLNDWSARDIQAWEYVPLGPFLGKSFATSISPWVTPLAALDAAWVDLPGQDPEPLPYLGPGATRGLDIDVEVELNGEVVSRPPYRTMYWSPAQMLAHMTVNGASLRTGDLFASGTISGPEPDQRGSFLELSWGGTEPFARRPTPSSRTATRWCSATPRRAPTAAGSRSARWPGGSSPRGPEAGRPRLVTIVLIARFNVNGWDERTIDGLEGGWMGAVEMRKEFTEGLTGTSVALFVSSGETEGQRSYFAAERITATTDDGRSGSVTVHHGGLESSPDIVVRPRGPGLGHRRLRRLVRLGPHRARRRRGVLRLRPALTQVR